MVWLHEVYTGLVREGLRTAGRAHHCGAAGSTHAEVLIRSPDLALRLSCMHWQGGSPVAPSKCRHTEQVQVAVIEQHASRNGGTAYPRQSAIAYCLHPSKASSQRGAATAGRVLSPVGRSRPPTGRSRLPAGRSCPGSGVRLPTPERTSRRRHGLALPREAWTRS